MKAGIEFEILVKRILISVGFSEVQSDGTYIYDGSSGQMLQGLGEALTVPLRCYDGQSYAVSICVLLTAKQTTINWRIPERVLASFKVRAIYDKPMLAQVRL